MSTYCQRYGSIVRELKTAAVVSVCGRFGDMKAPPAKVTALWDTGAYSSVINEKIVLALGLVPVARTSACGVNGWYDSPVYVIDLLLPNNMKITGLQVSLGNMMAADMLIGMDVMSLGDMQLTNSQATSFTIRTPSEGDEPFATSTAI